MKKYPFSFQKHGHDIEFRKNRVFCERHDMEMGDTPWDDEKYSKMCKLYDDLTELLLSCNAPVTFLPGKQLGLAKETVAWAEMARAARMK